jgi:transcriptional regulator with XRE-family HTH domain
MKTIRQLREERGWTQLELANRLGVTPSTIYNWERGRFDPRASQLRQLADAFGVKMDDIKLVPEEPGKARRRGLAPTTSGAKPMASFGEAA